MGPSKIIIIRHAEQHGEAGFTSAGAPDQESLTVKGWQRAGALIRRLCPPVASGDLPAVIFASGIGPNSETKRPQQTVEPLLAYVKERKPVEFCTSYRKPDVEALMADVMKRSGSVLIAWEHSRIPDLTARLPDPPRTPPKWPDDRYDLIWVLERHGSSWSFLQEAQMVLPGDVGIG